MQACSKQSISFHNQYLEYFQLYEHAITLLHITDINNKSEQAIRSILVNA